MNPVPGLRLRPIKKAEKCLREIEVLLISAQGLKNVKHLTKTRAYALVYVDHDLPSRTHVDEEGGVNPSWNERLKVKFRDKSPEEDVTAALNVDIYAHGHLREKPIGSARVLLCDVLKGGSPDDPADNPIQCLTLQVWRPSGRPQGLLNLWVPPTGPGSQSRGTCGSWRGESVTPEIEIEKAAANLFLVISRGVDDSMATCDPQEIPLRSKATISSSSFIFFKCRSRSINQSIDIL